MTKLMHEVYAESTMRNSGPPEDTCHIHATCRAIRSHFTAAA